MKKSIFLFIIYITINQSFSQDSLRIKAQIEANSYGSPVVCDSLGIPQNGLFVIDTNICINFDGYVSFEFKMRDDMIYIDSIRIQIILDMDTRNTEFYINPNKYSQLSPLAIILQDIAQKKLKNAFLVYPEKKRKDEYYGSRISYNMRFQVNSLLDTDDL